MTEESKNNSRLFTDNEMDQLLSGFYRGEVPQALDSPPSSWPQLNAPLSEQRKTAELTVAPATATTETAPTVNRGIAVAVATLAACLMVIVFSNVNPPSEQPGTVKSVVEPGEPDNQLMNVSSDNANGALDENQTSLEEIDQIELVPVAPQTTEKDD